MVGKSVSDSFWYAFVSRRTRSRLLSQSKERCWGRKEDFFRENDVENMLRYDGCASGSVERPKFEIPEETLLEFRSLGFT